MQNTVNSTAHCAKQTHDKTPVLSPVDMAKLIDSQERQIVQLRRQVAWFERQIFGQKSERHLPIPAGVQGTLGQAFDAIPPDLPPRKKVRIPAYDRQVKQTTPTNGADESTLFFDEKKVTVQTIVVPPPAIDGDNQADYEVIGEKVSYRLAQRPGSYVVLKYVRPVIKQGVAQTISCPPVPVGVIEGSRADVSFIAGMIVDKFAYHQPLYRQHTKLSDAGFKVSRAWLTKLMPKAVALLEPIFEAQLDSIRASRVKVMDETPMKAGPSGTGKMKSAYMWPVYGQEDEICFLYYPSRAAKHVQDALGLRPPADAVLQTDGYTAYAQYAQKLGLTHAQCWAHARRKIYEAQDIEPHHADQVLKWIGELYAVEARIREHQLIGQAKLALRQEKAKPIVAKLFAWIDQQFDAQGFLPSSPFLAALAYMRERRIGLEVYLSDADVSIDTNHLERALRVIPMGRKNWLFSWTELGAKHVGIVQSLLVTCRLHDINPYDYLVDVLQRVSQHPASKVHELTPRMWKQLFADNPLRSDLH